MGRKSSTFSGLSQFVLEAFKQGDGPAASSSTAQPSSHQTPTPSRPSTSQKPQNFVTSQRAAPSDSASDSTSGDASPSIGVVRKADALDEVEPDEEEAAETRGGKGKSREKGQSTPARKKRKVGLLGPGYENVDATGLVPFYTDASEVPAHLRKCTPLPASTLLVQLTIALVRLLPAQQVLLALRRRVSAGRRGLVQRHARTRRRAHCGAVSVRDGARCVLWRRRKRDCVRADV